MEKGRRSVSKKTLKSEKAWRGRERKKTLKKHGTSSK
jgi:hypothetical protein